MGTGGSWHLGEAHRYHGHQRGLAGGARATARALHTSLGNVTALLRCKDDYKIHLK